MRLRRGVLLLVIGALAATVTGCNLPAGRFGAKCSPVGKATQDGTYILNCAKNHRYKRIMTVAAGDALVQAYLLAHAPTTTAPPATTTTAPPPPPVTTFGAGTYNVGTTSRHVPAGLYTSQTSTDLCS